MTAKVRCDNKPCPWELDTPTFEETLAWHGKPCPECGSGPVVSDKDAELLALLIGLRDIGVVKMAGDPTAKGFKVTVDTAPVTPAESSESK